MCAQLEIAPEPKKIGWVPFGTIGEPQIALRMVLEPGAAACSKNAARAHGRELRSLVCVRNVARKMLPLVRILSACFFIGSVLLRACYAGVHISVFCIFTDS